jgi:Terminase RNaseH-like domain
VSAGGITFVDFAQRVVGVQLTDAQRVLCAVCFDGVEPKDLHDDDRELALRLFGEVDTVPTIARQVPTWVKGRGIGGTYLASLRGLHAMLTTSGASLAAGEAGFVGVVAPDKATARQALRFALGAARSVPTIDQLVIGETSDSFTIRRPDGVVTTFNVFASSRAGASLRGRTFFMVILSEVGHFRDQDYVVNDVEIFEAVRPRVVPTGQILLESTPWMESGLLWTQWQQNFADPRTALVAHAPTELMRDDPHTLAMVAAERERGGLAAARELDGLFMSSGTNAWFSGIAACVTDRAATLPPSRSRCDIGVGIDMGFRSDASALVVVKHEGGIYRVVEVDEMRPTKTQALQPSAVVNRFANVAKRHNARGWLSDLVYIESIRELASKLGIQTHEAPSGNPGKVRTFSVARDIIAEARLEIPAEHTALIKQLREVVARPTSGGSFSITSPRRRGAHGDQVSALVLALWRCDQQVRRGSVGMDLITVGGRFDDEPGVVRVHERPVRERIQLRDGRVAYVRPRS